MVSRDAVGAHRQRREPEWKEQGHGGVGIAARSQAQRLGAEDSVLRKETLWEKSALVTGGKRIWFCQY